MYVYIYVHICTHVYIHIFLLELGVPTEGGDQTKNIYDCQNFKQVFTGVPVTFKQVFTGVPKILNVFHGSKRKSPSLQKVDGKPVQSGNSDI